MPRKKVNKDPLTERAIAQYIRVDGDSLSNIRVDLDNLSVYLMKEEQRHFSVAKFERMMKQEMELKLLGRLFTESSMKAVCAYINKLSKYLTEDLQNAERKKFEEISKRRGDKPKP